MVKEKTYAAEFFIIFILVLAVIFGSVFWQVNKELDRKASYTYNGFAFVQAPSGDDYIWVTQIEVDNQLYNIPFYFHPSATEDVFVTEGLADAIVNAPVRPDKVFISLDPDAGSRPVIAAVEISRLLGTKYNLLNMQVQSALSRETNSTDSLIITCDAATDGTLVFLFSLGSTNQITNEGNCVMVEYTSAEESIRVADRFAYELLKIM